MGENKIIQLANIMPTATRENPNQGRIYDIRGMAPTITDVSGGGGRQPMIVTRNRIRKLTPLECWRLMGFSDADFRRAEAGNSNTQLYKQAGNSIVKNVLIAVFGQMIPGADEIYKLYPKEGNKQMKERKYVKETPVILYDKAGYPSMMLKLENTAPTKELADPVFLVKEVEYDSIYLSRFLNSAAGDHVVSLPFRDPLVMVSMDEAIRLIRKKGPEWHLLTNCEWQYIKDTTAPNTHGNTSCGKYHGDSTESGIGGKYGCTETGSGPASWFHNGSKETGIADTIGNVWKIVSGIRLKRGRLEYMANNDAAAPDADLSEESREFLEVLVDGRPVNIGPGEDGMMVTTGEVEGWDCVDREDVCVDLKTVPQVLKDLGIITDDMGASTELFAADAGLDEAVCFVGGCCDGTSDAGSSALNVGDPRSSVLTDIGFFSACLGKPVIR